MRAGEGLMLPPGVHERLRKTVREMGLKGLAGVAMQREYAKQK